MTPDQVVWLLIGFRVLIGVAQGGEYPCCAVSTTELTSHIKTKRRGMVIVGVNAYKQHVGGGNNAIDTFFYTFRPTTLWSHWDS